jgi:ATP-dependent DNA helicase RecG
MQNLQLGREMEIEKLIEQAESKTLEFKSDLSSLNPILKTIVAFANTAGGTLIVGCSQKREILGIEDIFKAEEKLANAIADSIHPPILPEIEISTLNGKNLLVVRVAHWKGPFYLKKLGTPSGVYVRLGSTSRPAGPELLAEMQRTVLHLSFDEQSLSELSPDSLELEKAKMVFQQAERDLNEKKLRTLGVLLKSANRLVPSIGGLILFGKQEVRQQFLPDAKVSCARFRGDDKTEIIDRYEVDGTILDAVDAVPKFIQRNTRMSAEIRNIRRKNISEYPPIAIREVLINALAHCDYSIKGSRIQIAVFNNRLEVQNPGMLPFGFTLEDLRAGVSRVRNRVIARVFSELNLMEEWGSGYKRIVEACHAGGYPEPEWQELGTSFRVTFYPHGSTVLQEEKQTTVIKDLQSRQAEILNILVVGESLPFRQIVEKLPFSISERSLRYDLAWLRSLGFITSKGKGRAIVWERLR